MEHSDELAELRARVRILEERVQGLRTSRRILMNLLAAQEREKRVRITRLEAENRKLQQRAGHFARQLLENNIRLVRIQHATRAESGRI